ncbi:MAG: fibronectin type III domain-containing protein [Ignavibacteria bacterium]|nr:fibronectin type III domain-containing protein [Ignavibacteria bacterium]
MSKYLFNIKTMIAAICAIAVIGCNENTTGPVNPTAPGAPDSLMAQSVSQTSIGVKWKAPLAGATPTSYSVEYNEMGSATTMKKSVGSTTLMTELTGLTDGMIYEVKVYALNDTARSFASNMVSWAPARRGSGTFFLYTSNNKTKGSGLSIFRQANANPAVLTIDKGDEWDICFDDLTSASDPRIASPGQTNFVDANYKFSNGKEARTTYWGAKFSGVNSLDDIYETAALSVPATGGEKFYSLGSIGGTTNWGSVIASKNADGTYNFAKVLVHRATTGIFVNGSGTEQYIEVSVSYQTVANVPYALKMKLDQALSAHAAQKLND